MTMTADELQTLRDELDRRARELGVRHARLEAHLHHKNGPAPADFEEQATERENDEVLEALDDAALQELTLIGDAIAAMDAGTYGRCVECGKAIPFGRLQVLPFTPVCVKCAAELEE